MKRRFSRTDNRALLSGGRSIALGLVALVAVLASMRFVFPDALIALSRPLYNTGNVLTAAVGSVTGSFENADQVRLERDALKAQAEALANENGVLAAKVADLTKLVGVAATPENRVLAGVIARPPLSPYDTLLIAAGTLDDVHVGASVFGPGGVPVGTVTDASEHNAHVSLYSSSGRETGGWAGETRVPVALVGAGSGSFRATLNKDVLPAIGDPIYVPGPGALPIGIVARIDTDPSSPNARLFIRPVTNPFMLTWVAIAP